MLAMNKPYLPATLIDWHLETTAWMIHIYGAPATPRVPTVFTRFTPLQDQYFDSNEDRTVSAWADDQLALLRLACGLGDQTMRARPVNGASDALRPLADSQVVETTRVMLSHAWHCDAPGHIEVDFYNNPVFDYEPKRCGEPGYFTRVMIRQLAQYKLCTGPAPEHYSTARHAAFVMAMATHMGLGLVTSAMSDALVDDAAAMGHVSRSDRRTIVKEMVLSPVLSMMARRLTPEQILGSHGSAMDARTRKSIWSAAKGLKKFEPELKLLRVLSDGPATYQDNVIPVRRYA